MEYNCLSLNQIADNITEKISIDDISTLNYISTENMIVNKAGVEEASKLPNTKKVNFYRKKDILVSNIRPYFKKIWQADNDGGASADVLIYRANQNYIDEEYLYYFLSQDSFFDFMVQTSKGTKMPRGDKNAIANYEVSFPKNIAYQRKVASIGRTIDEKIKLNKKTIANLEELSQTLFKRWFIDFEFPDENGSPYKSSKGKMKKSSIGEIPAHWEITDIQEMTTKFTTGLNPRKNFTLGEGSNYYVTIKNMGNNDIILDERCDKVTDEAIEIINKRSDLQVGDVLFSGIGTIGRTYLIYKDPHNWNTSESIFSLRPSDKISSVYLYNLLLSEGVQDYSVQMSSGSVQKGIRKRDLERYTFALSNDNIEDYFEELVSPLQNKIHNLRDENLKLVELRDTLLPKLMSGEIELPDELEVDEHAELLQ